MEYEPKGDQTDPASEPREQERGGRTARRGIAGGVARDAGGEGAGR